jgi:beta-lactamase class D
MWYVCAVLPQHAYRIGACVLCSSLLSLATSCSSGSATRAPALPAPPAPPTRAATPAAPPAAAVQELADVQRFFAAERVTGTIALLDTARGVMSCSDVQRCQRAVIPASTFKIPHTLIALELGVLEDAETAMRWDGQERPIADWNQDHTLRTAMRVSCVPCFQAVARRIGPERMQDWLRRLDFGNHDISGGLDRFWLTGGLRISPLAQIEFLRRLDQGLLPVQAKSVDVLRDVITLDVGFEHVLRGKTGWAAEGDADREYGWFVGWLELGERRVYYATLIDGHEPGVDIRPVRRRLTETILTALGALPKT